MNEQLTFFDFFDDIKEPEYPPIIAELDKELAVLFTNQSIRDKSYEVWSHVPALGKRYCIWVDMVTQQNNRRSNKYLTYKGITQTYAEWAREYEIPESNLLTRLKKGWGIEEALNTPKIDNLVDMVGKKYNRLTVIKRVAIPEHIKSRGTYYLCRCDCGTEKVILGRSLRSGNTQSCGCLWVERNNSKKTKGGG